MKGYLYQFVDREDSSLGLYWSEEEIPDYLLREAFRNWESDEYYDDMEFEEFWNIGTSEIKIERVFVEEIYV